MKRNILLLFAALLSSAAGFSPIGTSVARPDKDYALFFAVNDYDKWPDLANPISDVELIAKDLRDLYGFETEIVRNPDRTTILNTIEKYRAKTYAADAQLLVFFSGHGEFNESTKQGYFVPKGGLKTDAYGDSYIEYESLKRRITTLPCKHIMLALDACYSGTADEGIAMRGTPGKRPGDNSDTERERYISSSLQYKSRMMITSGAKVRTPDKSAFVAKFLEALRSQGGGDGLVNAPELFSYLTTASPKPVISTFGDHEPGGEFLFIGKSIKLNASTQVSATTPVNTEADDRVFEKASSRNTVEAYQDYLDVFPEGRHVGECKAAITGLKPQPNTVQAETNTDPSKIPSDGFVLVTGGTFTMGSSETEPNRNSDEPQHKVTLSNFYISPYEVTQQQWKQVMGNNPSTGSKDCDQCPVESISWDDVQDFLRKLNIKSPGRNYRLPTEAEWEYAARGGKKIKNYLYAGSNDIGLVAWYTNNSGNKTQFVGKRKANELGLYDMSGNVWEWCSDWKDAYPFEDQTNPVGPPSGSNRVVRGGSWGSFPQYCQVKFRDGNPSGFRNYGVGFRLARTK